MKKLTFVTCQTHSKNEFVTLWPICINWVIFRVYSNYYFFFVIITVAPLTRFGNKNKVYMFHCECWSKNKNISFINEHELWPFTVNWQIFLNIYPHSKLISSRNTRINNFSTGLKMLWLNHNFVLLIFSSLIVSNNNHFNLAQTLYC